MSSHFNLYMKTFDDFFLVTGNATAKSDKKKALLQAVGGLDMVWLFDFIGKVTDQHQSSNNRKNEPIIDEI